MPRIAFMTAPEIGRTYILDDRPHTVLREESYAKTKGGAGVLVIWAAKCLNCATDFELKTGRMMGDVYARCPACRQEIANRRPSRLCLVPVLMRTIQEALRRFIVKNGPQPMSLSRTASHENLYAPALLRKAQPELLASHTLEEIRVALEKALRRKLICWDTVARYGSGNARKGLVLGEPKQSRRSEPTPSFE